MKRIIALTVVAIVISILIVSKLSFKIGNTIIGKSTDEISLRDDAEIANSSFQKNYLNKKGLVIVNLWATWCQPCLEEMPILKEIATENKEVTLVFLSIDRDSTKLQSYLSQHRMNDITFENRNYRKAIRKFLNEKAEDIIPQTYIIKDGKVVYKEEGGIHYQDFSKKLNSFK